jgi:hypothetical protein
VNSRTTARVLLAALGAGGLAALGWVAVASMLADSPPDCLEGTWAIDPESVRASALAGLGELDGLDPEVSLEGDTLMTFRDGAYTIDYDQQADITIVADGKTPVAGVGIVGVATGPYTATDTEVSVVDIDADDVRHEMTMTLDGVAYDPGDVADAAAASLAADATSTYRCSDDELVLTPVVDGVEMPEHASVHHRR